jgi:hypothetical protein
MTRKVYAIIATGLALFAAAFILLHMYGCRSREAIEVAHETAYTAELLRCVDKAETLTESRACRRATDERWGIVEPKDGGK